MDKTLSTRVWGPGVNPGSEVLLAVPGDVVTADQMAEWDDDEAIRFEATEAEPEPEPEATEAEPEPEPEAEPEAKPQSNRGRRPKL